jgi:poly(3-hydroxybutyrate) depolymerase
VQLWTIADAGHVYPVREDQGVSAAAEMARFWGIAG